MRLYTYIHLYTNYYSMKTTLKHLGFLLLASLFIFSVEAAENQKAPRTPEQSAKASTRKLAKLLDLTAQQKESIGAIDLEYYQNVAKAKDELSTEDAKAEIKKLRKLRSQKIKAELTPEQYKIWRADLKEKAEAKKKKAAEKAEAAD